MRRKIKNDILNFLNQDAKKKALLVTGLDRSVKHI